MSGAAILGFDRGNSFGLAIWVYAVILNGYALDETHIELDCESCHIDKKFDKAPDCASCHDDNRNSKKTPPGQFIKIGKS